MKSNKNFEDSAKEQSSKQTKDSSTSPTGSENSNVEYVFVKTWRKKWISPIVDGFLYLLTAITVVFLTLHIMTSFFGFHMYSFDSGSMEPTIPIGSVSMTKEVEDPLSIEEGDIITVIHPQQAAPLTHRVTRVNDPDSIENALLNNVQYGVSSGERDFLHKLTLGMLGESTESFNSATVTEEAIEDQEVIVINMQGDDNEREDPRVYVIGQDSAHSYLFHVPNAEPVRQFILHNIWWVLTAFGAMVFFVLYPFRDYKRVPKASLESAPDIKEAENVKLDNAQSNDDTKTR